MAQLKHARSFRDLVVYQKTRHVAKEVFELTKGFPKYVTTQQMDKLVADLCEIGRMRESMMQQSGSFCGQDGLMVREDRAEYFVTDD